MSRAIRSSSLTPPTDIDHYMSYDESREIRNFIDDYARLDDNRTYYQSTSLDPGMPSIKISVNGINRLLGSFTGNESGMTWLESNSIYESVAHLTKASSFLKLYNLLENVDADVFVELNEYSKILFAGIGKTDRLDTTQTYNYTTNMYEDNPAHELGIEWAEHFRLFLVKIGFEEKDAEELAQINRYWRVDSLLSATESMAANKFHVVSLSMDLMSQVPFDQELITNPLLALSKVMMVAQPLNTNYYDGNIDMYAKALQDVAFANDFAAKNPQVKTIGLTELSSYNHQSYYFKGTRAEMTKQNTQFLEISVLPNFTRDDLMLLSEQFKEYARGFVNNSSQALKRTMKKQDKLTDKKFLEAKEVAVNHWKELIKHLYSQNAIDEIGYLYTTLLFPQIHQPKGNQMWSSVNKLMQPVQEKYVERIDLGEDYSVTILLYQAQVGFQFATPRNTLKTTGTEDLFNEVKTGIIELGVPQYLRQPMNQVLSEGIANTNQSADFELRGLAQKIRNVENNRSSKIESINECRSEVASMKFV